MQEKLIYLISTRSRSLELLILILALGLCVMTSLQVIKTICSDYELAQTKPPETSAELTDQSSMQLIAAIPQAHLFGQAAVDDDFLPITNLQLHLTGIIDVPEKNLSRVIIAEGNQPGKIYGVGDELTAGIVINSIENGNVILEHQGRLEKLPLGRAPLVFQPSLQPMLFNH